MRKTAALLCALLGTTALAGCAPDGGTTATTATVTTTVTETATATVTVTATPAPAERSYDDPISAPDAWEICVGAAYGVSPDGYTFAPYQDGPIYGGYAVTDNGDGTFAVQVGYAPPPDSTAFGGQIICTVSGTVGSPVVSTGGRDFG